MNSYLKNMPRKGVSAVADFGDQIVEDKLKKDDEDFQINYLIGKSNDYFKNSPQGVACLF